MTLYTWITLISSFAFILLTTPSSMTGLMESALLFPLAIAWILKKKPGNKPEKLPFLSIAIALCVLGYLGVHFFTEWSGTSQVAAIAAMLHLSARTLTLITAAGLSVCAVWSLSGLFLHMKAVFHGGAGKRQLLYGFLGSAVTVILSQIMIETDVLAMGLFKFLWGTGIVAVVILLALCLSGRVKASVALGSGLLMVLSTANGYVYRFRDRLLDPLDIFSIGTALNVADNYSLFPIPWGIVTGWAVWIGFLVWLFKICPKEDRLGGKKRLRLGVYCLIGIIAAACYTTPLKTYYWDKEGAVYNGYILNFVAKFKEVRVSKPDGYSPEGIRELSEQYGDAADLSQPDAELPHIIVIMDEAFSDLSVFGQIETDTEPTPFISALRESTVSGYALASVYGGNTANSEFEFLTGNSMAWLSPNAVPYQQYINSPAYSIVSYLKGAYGYRCVSMHPYLANGWNRPDAYGCLGFDECFFLEDFPQEDYIREYVSDQEMFETLVQIYESRREEPLFLFGVSMQNHGGYSYTGDNYTQSVSLTGFDTAYPRVEQYLSVIHETDKAVEYLISYFSQVEEDVVILFFGDHQPKLDAEFYSEFSESGDDSLDEQQRKYLVPFFIWANYPLEAEQIPCTSLNYLSSYLYEAAGIPLPRYNRFLSEMEQVIPAINANGFYSLTQQCYLPLEDAAGEEKAWLLAYQQLQYNNLFDIKHRDENIFPVVP